MTFYFSEASFPAKTALNTDHLTTHHYSLLQQYDSTSVSPLSLDNPENSLSHVLGESIIDLTSDKIHDFLIRELNIPVLDEMYIRL
jgi:hypothetical protein